MDYLTNYILNRMSATDKKKPALGGKSENGKKNKS